MTTKFPQEIWDQILIETGDLRLALLYKNDYASDKIFDPTKHNYFWAILQNENSCLIFDFLLKKEKYKRHLRSVFVDAIWFKNFEIAKTLIEKRFVSLCNNIDTDEIDSYIDDVDSYVDIFDSYVDEVDSYVDEVDSYVDYDLDEDTEDLLFNCFSFKADLDTVHFFEQYNIIFTQYILDEICSTCDLETFNYLIDRGYRFTQIAIVNAVSNGNIEILDALLLRDDIQYDNDNRFPVHLMDLACENSQLVLMKYLFHTYGIFGSHFIFEKAILTRNKDIVMWVYSTHEIELSQFARVLLTSYFTDQEIFEMGIIFEEQIQVAPVF